jgi:hypothetical protein
MLYILVLSLTIWQMEDFPLTSDGSSAVTPLLVILWLRKRGARDI